MELTPESATSGGNVRHHVAGTPLPRLRTSVVAALVGTGHAATFIALGAGTLWLAARGAGALPLVEKVLVGGLALQVLPAIGFGVVTRHLIRFGRPSAAVVAGGLSLFSVLLMGVGALQAFGGGGVQTGLLALAMALSVALALGVPASRLAHAVKHRFEAEPLILVDPEA